jgi:hypothetical protein
MTLVWPVLLIAVALAGLGLAYWAVRGQRIDLYAPADLERYAQPVDLAAFQALLDPANEAFVRENLLPREVRDFQRRRCRVAAAYVRRVAQNAAVLTRLAELARTSGEPETARAGAELANAALQLRLLALLSYARLRLELILPAAPDPIRRVAGLALAKYEALADRASNVAARLEPASAMRCARALYSR